MEDGVDTLRRAEAALAQAVDLLEEAGTYLHLGGLERTVTDILLRTRRARQDLTSVVRALEKR